ncbi:DUF6338 family protein [Desulfatibacillum aliphaticivorans]|uniref:DUF6338 family protein n=1 Tax=Desulfatibacillum aliphaticivorans TaxID=218208 RepID=UPI00047FA7C2|nr:DUF6338 family protein [Desulfatibacillum aliphaticivorans]
MQIAPDFNSLPLFVLLVFPGLISLHIYRLLMPTKDVDWKTVTFEGLFYSALNFALCLPLIIYTHTNNYPSTNPYGYSAWMMIMILVAPIVWAYLWSKLIRCKPLMKKMNLPYPTAWDFFFDKRVTLFVLIHLKNGNKIAGYYGPNSYATSYPREGDIYLEAAIKVNDKGEFLDFVNQTGGLLVRKADYELIEFFNEKQNKQGKEE